MTARRVDAGPLVALLHRDDRDHALCVGALLEMIERGVLQVLPLEVDDLPDIRKLMKQYADLPMDFADATLVQVAKRQGIGQPLIQGGYPGLGQDLQYLLKPGGTYRQFRLGKIPCNAILQLSAR